MRTLSPLVLLMFMLYLLMVLTTLTLWFALTYRRRSEPRPGRAPQAPPKAPRVGASRNPSRTQTPTTQTPRAEASGRGPAPLGRAGRRATQMDRATQADRITQADEDDDLFGDFAKPRRSGSDVDF